MKEDDDALGLVRDYVRDERADDAALEALARGESGEATAALGRRAATDDAAATLIVASRPLAAGISEAIAHRVAMQRRTTQPRRLSWMSRRVPPVAGGLALVAAVVLYMAAGRSKDGPVLLLPDYSLVASGDESMRGPPTVNAGGAVLHLRGRAARAVRDHRAAHGRRGHEGRRVSLRGRGRRAASGRRQHRSFPGRCVRVRGTDQALDGVRALRLVIGVATDSAARYDDARNRARDGRSDARVRVLAVPILRE